MLLDPKESFLAQHTTAILTTHDRIQPFSNHAKLPFLTDILSRKFKHHLLLKTNFDRFTHRIFLESILSHYQRTRSQENVQMLLLNLDNLHISDIKQIAIEKEFEQLRAQLTSKKQTLILALTNPDLFSKDTKKADERFLRRELEILINHAHCRLILMMNYKQECDFQHLKEMCIPVEIEESSLLDNLTLLKHQCTELEKYHQVEIPEDVLTQALHLSQRYLHTPHPLEKTILLLDSAAARLPHSGHTTPVLTEATLLSLLSDWTHIPNTQLKLDYFHLPSFTQHIQQSLYGQEIAAHLLGEAMVEAHSSLKEPNRPYANFLFIGKEHSGKETAAYLLSDYLFKTDCVYIITEESTHHSFASIKAKRKSDHKTYRLLDLIQEIPYAVILFNHAEKLNSEVLDALSEIIGTGHYEDSYDFSQATIILAANIDKADMEEFVETFSADEDVYTMDLMQLIMSDQKQALHHEVKLPTAEEVLEKIIPKIAHCFSPTLIQQLKLIPFLPLQKAAIEKIMRHKLKIIGKQLENQYQIELGYAPEVIRYLTSEAVLHDNLERTLAQLYTCIEQAVLCFTQQKNSSNQLFLQLNETGHSLRYDWLVSVAPEMLSS